MPSGSDGAPAGLSRLRQGADRRLLALWAQGLGLGALGLGFGVGLAFLNYYKPEDLHGRVFVSALREPAQFSSRSCLQAPDDMLCYGALSGPTPTHIQNNSSQHKQKTSASRHGVQHKEGARRLLAA